MFILLFMASASALPFSAENAKAYVDTLCLREFVGRKSGDGSAHLAEEWIGQKFAEFGLKPGGGDGYLQYFPILNNQEMSASLELINGYHGKKRYQLGEDFHLLTNSGSGSVKAEVVFVGYGLCEPGKGWDDYTQVDIKGKIALIYRELPAPERKWEEQQSREYRAKMAVEHGAGALMFVQEKNAVAGAAIKAEAFYSTIPMLMISETVAGDLFRGTGKSYSSVIEDLSQSSQSFNTGKIVNINTRLKFNPQAKAANVIGVILGGDSLLQNEWIIIGGHMDHNGKNAVGDIFYGADDNASGTAVVMELARCFASMETPPKRSLMFIAFAAEEQGLLGSEYFINHSTIPHNEIAAMFNYDMCGCGEGKVGLGGMEHFPQIWAQYKKGLYKEDLDLINLSMIWGHGSDNFEFEQAGIPTFNCWSSGRHPFYHNVEDLPGAISLKALGNVGRISGDFITYLANYNEALISEYYTQKTLLNSAFTINLNPVEKSMSEDTKGLTARLEAMKMLGLKCELVSISGENPYKDFDFWGQLCKNENYQLVESSADLKNTARKQKLALMPVLTNWGKLDSTGTDLRNLFSLGVKTIVLDDELENMKQANRFISQAIDLGMLFILPEKIINSDSSFNKAKKLLLMDNCAEKIPILDLKTNNNLRFAIVPNFVELMPDSNGSYQQTVYLNLSWDTEKDLHTTLKFIKRLEEAGFKREEIKYMLGENLLEILP